jgi:LPXTG-site transpeptidase (sortase) family protein
MPHSLKKIYKKEKLGFCSLVLGLVLILIFVIYRFHQVRILSFNTKDFIGIQETNWKGVQPVFIQAFPVGVNVKVGETSIVDGVWQILPDAAGHLSSSARIGDTGNMIIYGHNKNEILGPIRWIKVGETIVLKDKDGNTYSYRVTKTDTVNPNNVSYIQPTNEETLTVYTCIGLLDNQRFVVVAKRI